MTIRIKNPDDLPVADINAQMREPRPLPMGRADFEAWSDRIISGALVPGAEHEDQKYALASMVMSLGPTESHKPDAYFIHCLRKTAANQVAHAFMLEIYGKKHPEKMKEKLEAEARAKETLDRVGA